MTLPSRRKHRTIVLSFQTQETLTKSLQHTFLAASQKLKHATAKAFAIASLGGIGMLSLTNTAAAQTHTWQPTRLPATSSARPIQQAESYQSPAANPYRSTNASAKPAKVLRWTVGKQTAAKQAAKANSSRSNSTLAALAAPTSQPSVAAEVFSQQPSQVQTASSTSSTNSGNPLRGGLVRTASYQQDPFAEPSPQTPPIPGTQPPIPNANAPVAPGTDPLALPEIAPPPSSVLETPEPPQYDTPEDPVAPPNPFPNNDESPADLPPIAQPGTAPQQITPSLDELEALRARGDFNSLSCKELRDRLRNRPISAVSLDLSPPFGEGLRRTAEDIEKNKQEFVANAEFRDWTDYKGVILATGRMVDLRYNRVIVETNDGQKEILFRDLSDVDVAYVGEVWNIPERCGIGYERFAGRNFIASTVQWTAPGMSHKPAYFEQVQLERYGHEVGPVLQPVISSAHFFGSIFALPYKMGIHPPNECQYPLGYYRPGDCAPYMIQPIPLSLRGAATQAAAVTGAAALIP